MKVKEKSEIVGLKLNIQKNKIMASGPIISWEIYKYWEIIMFYLLYVFCCSYFSTQL